MAKEHKATERLSFEEARQRLARAEPHVKTVLARVGQVRPLRPGDSILEIGTAQGALLINFAKLGYRAVGIEPWEEAIATAAQLAKHEGVEISMHKGVAESIPLLSEQFDAVFANSVIEHVLDVRAVFGEVYRVLKPGGAFWFFAASSVCPRQHEIKGFPCFGWYPDRLKRRIMEWAKTHKPHLIGYTQTPAINWFTTRKARRMLLAVGFNKIYDRWDVRLPSEGGRLYRIALRVIQLNGVTKFLANVLVGACSYTAIK